MIRLFKRRPEPAKSLQELLEITVKAGRRCAYDLSHAADHMADKEDRALYAERAKYWLSVFNPGNDGKNYRNQFHQQIFRMECHIDRLKKQLKDAGIEPDDDWWGPNT